MMTNSMMTMTGKEEEEVMAVGEMVEEEEEMEDHLCHPIPDTPTMMMMILPGYGCGRGHFIPLRYRGNSIDRNLLVAKDPTSQFIPTSSSQVF